MAMHIEQDKYNVAKHLIAINEKLMDVMAGRCRRLIINMPPQHGKSELVSKFFPLWYLGNNPDKNIMLVSYQTDFAAERSRLAKDLFAGWGEELFDLQLDKRVGSAYRWTINGHKGGVKATGIGGDLTGRGADVLIIDDPIKNDEQALSKTYRDKAFQWFKATAYPRLAPGGAIIIIMTRWHHDDLCGRILNSTSNEYGEWEVLKFPAIAGDNDLLGRKPGDALWPYRYDINTLNDTNRTLGTFWFSAEYQQEPIASEYQIFKPEWWSFYKERPECPLVLQVWDTAFEEGQNNDYSVCVTVGIRDHNAYVFDVCRRKVLFPDLKRLAVAQYNIWKPRWVGIEKASSGHDLIPSLKSESKIPIRPIKTMNKEIRAHIVSPIVEAGKVFLPEDAPWVPDFINEMSEFPQGRNDDQVDGFSMLILSIQNLLTENTSQTKTGTREKREIKTKNNRFSNY